MENLLVLLDKIQQLSPLPVFSQDTVVVQNPGMQHWLNLTLAKQRGISMNMRYALPAQFLWKLIRQLASDEEVPEQSPYSREVLAWRIHALLVTDEVCQDEDFQQATHYWRGDKNANSGSYTDNEKSALKRYQLACQLADLYEQYLIFRPEWIDLWHQGKMVLDESKTPFSDDFLHQNDLPKLVLWQAKLWQLLINEQPYNPVSLMQDAIANIADKKHTLPARLSFFGINAMAPMWLDFINALSEHIDIHFFHLNPCFAYWGDIITEKQAIRAIEQWVDGYDDISQAVGNPLLANFGQQGREFMALLQNYSTVNIEVFDSAVNSSSIDDASAAAITPSLSVLAQVQQDILSLVDMRQNPINHQDDSITITSCHSALREVQGLHDWLLHQFNDDKSLTPKDVLVMCPQIETYAPYVNAVFTRGWQEISDEIPPLPCSIADRSSKDAEPVIAAFSEILHLPDSRFHVSQLVGLLRLPAMQSKFGINSEELTKITTWLEQACVHWGLDKVHKQQVLKSDLVNDSFTWQQGLSRLLRGFAFGDGASDTDFGESVIYQEQLLLSSIEGDDAQLLGKLMLIIEQLQYSSKQLATARSATEWQSYLMLMVNDLFDIDADHSFSLIIQAIESLVEFCSHAHFEEKIDLMIVRDFLNNHFSQPDPGRQFMVGQVTFCSMLPMRSIPFKIIAILGLNDGEFPRQRQPLGFDLMEVTPTRLGDRSRRGDDRYLFLEAIISARQSLYLSYQGKNIKNNTEKQASLVLKELMEYLEIGFNWRFSTQGNFVVHQCEVSDDTNTSKLKPNVEGVEVNQAIQATISTTNLRQLPMQAFSEKNYQGKYNGFDSQWLSLKPPVLKLSASATRGKDGIDKESEFVQNEILIIETPPVLDDEYLLSTEQLISFYQHPAKAFAQKQLNLYLDQKQLTLDDAEPFSSDRLQSYLLRQQLLTVCLASNDKSQTAREHLADEQVATINVLEQQLSQVLYAAKLSGKFPDLPNTQSSFESWQQDSVDFSHAIIEQDADNAQYIDCQVSLLITDHHIGQVNMVITTKLPVKNGQLVFYRSSSAKAKDFFSLYLNQLMLQVWQDQYATRAYLASMNEQAQTLSEVTQSRGLFFDTKSQKVSQYLFKDLRDAKAQLTLLIETYLAGQQQALLLNGEIAEKAFKDQKSDKAFGQDDFEKIWQDPNAVRAIGDDPYMHYFWPQCPDFVDIECQLQQIYKPMYQQLDKLKTNKNTNSKASSIKPKEDE